MPASNSIDHPTELYTLSAHDDPDVVISTVT
jgi:hypothetical protein